MPRSGAPTSFNLTPVALGNTGLVLEASGISVFLDPNNPPPVKPSGWRGCVSRDTGPVFITLSNSSIGSDGISGNASVTWNTDYNSTSRSIRGDIVARLGGMTFARKSVSISLINNAIFLVL